MIAGIDLATKTGFAVIDGHRLVAYGTIQAVTAQDLIDLLAQLSALGVTHAVVENVYCGSNVATAIMLATLRGRLLQELDRAGITWELISPSTWRSTTIRPPAKTKRKDLKKMAKDFVASRFAIAATADEADAICLAVHAQEST